MERFRTLALAVILAAGIVTAPSPAEAITIDWGSVTPPPAAKRVIEVVDKIKPSAWKVGKAVTWLDRYTASDMRLVGKCSGKAYRCITVRQGKVKGAPVGWSSGSTITIDTAKAGRAAYRPWFRSEKTRTWLLVHELAHQHGLGHGSGRHVMNPRVDRYRMVLTAGQKKALRSR